jgi:DNA repair protein RadB
MEERISTGSDAFDKLLGGFDKDCITTVYGPAGSGKTNVCLTTLKNVIESGKKVVFFDTEGGLSISRLSQLCDDVESILKNVIIFKPTSFKDQAKDFEKLKKIVNDKIGLIVIDSIAYLYRLELGSAEDIYKVNKNLGVQIGALTEITRKLKIPVLITNQVYSAFDDREKVFMVGGDLLKYGSKCLIELQITPENNRRAILKKHRYLPEERSIVFKIKEKGLFETKEGKGFKLF